MARRYLPEEKAKAIQKRQKRKVTPKTKIAETSPPVKPKVKRAKATVKVEKKVVKKRNLSNKTLCSLGGQINSEGIDIFGPTKTTSDAFMEKLAALSITSLKEAKINLSTVTKVAFIADRVIGVRVNGKESVMFLGIGSML